MNLNPSIFKAYDIRGIYPTELDDEGAYAIGRAYATLIKKELQKGTIKIVIGSDMRLSSPALKKNLIEGILDTGVSVEHIGVVSTPTFYFTVAYGEYDGGIQVSASHNPKEWNGFKLVRQKADAMDYENGISEIQKIITEERFAPLVNKTHRGIFTWKENVVQSQTEEQSDIPRNIKPLNIIIDTANSMGILEMRELFSRLPFVSVTWMNEELDGSFPAHEPDPMKEENTKILRHAIISQKYDLGIASDGDGDRYFFFDEKGNAIPQEIIRGILAQIELQQNPGGKIVYDVRPGKITEDMIRAAGGVSVLAPVGHSLIKGIMKKEGAIFGGELSGHFFYRLPYGTFEAPIVLVLKFLTFISEQNKPVSEIIAPYKKYFHSGEINTHLSSKEAGKKCIEKIKTLSAQDNQNHIDGLLITYPEVWFSIRLSNTEPLLRLIVEGKDKSVVEKKRDEILSIIQEFK